MYLVMGITGKVGGAREAKGVIAGTEHVAGTTSARDVFAAAQNAVKA